MTLILEDGTLVADADTYATLDVSRAFTEKRGFVPVATDIALEADLIKAMDFIESHRDKFKGDIVDETQSLQWPRKNVYINNFLFDEKSIPQELIDAQCQLAIELSNGVVLLRTVTEAFITEQTVDVIKTKYDEKGAGVNSNSLPYVDIFLDVLLTSTSVLQAIRI
jgi:hypothetical protein